jgi:trehalose-6-phosphate synthase
MSKEEACRRYIVLSVELSEEKKCKHKKTTKVISKEDLAAWNQELEQELKDTQDKWSRK